MTGMEGPPLVVFGDDWGRHVSSMQHLFRHLIPTRPVVWVNGIGHRAPSLTGTDVRRGWEKLGKIVRRTDPVPSRSPVAAADNGCAMPLEVIEPRVLPWHHRPLAAAWNARWLSTKIRSVLAKHGLTEPPMIITGSPPSVLVFGRLGERGTVYFCMDDFLHLPGISVEMIGPLEERLLRRVDAVVATAEVLTHSKRPSSGEVHYLPQGVNFEHFATPRPVPLELAALPRPMVGFAGGVSECCDLDLINRLAVAYSGGSVVLVGPITIPAERLEAIRRPNVHLLGPRAYADLPGYVQAFDVGIIPYLLNDWTRAVDPLKLLEYLAAGLPVVTTPLPEAQKYRDAVRVADDGDFVAAVGAACRDGGPEDRAKRIALAQRNSWVERARVFSGILDGVRRRVA